MGVQEQTKQTKKIAFAGILTALGAAALFLENISPTGKLGFYVFAGFVLSVVIMECGMVYGWVSFAATSLIAFLLAPEKTAILPYALFFGIYALVKSLIERIDRVIAEWILKIAFFNLSLYFMWNIAQLLIPANIFEVLPMFAVILILEVVFVLFDILFTFWTQYYLNKLQPKLRRR